LKDVRDEILALNPSNLNFTKSSYYSNQKVCSHREAVRCVVSVCC